ncbi:MAG: hypothetical protein QXX41_10350 [Nitrososphaerota archaeon]
MVDSLTRFIQTELIRGAKAISSVTTFSGEDTLNLIVPTEPGGQMIYELKSIGITAVSEQKVKFLTATVYIRSGYGYEFVSGGAISQPSGYVKNLTIGLNGNDAIFMPGNYTITFIFGGELFDVGNVSVSYLIRFNIYGR